MHTHQAASNAEQPQARAKERIVASATPGQANPRRGYYFAVLNAIISGVAIYVNSIGVRMFSDSTLYTTLKNAVVGIALLVPVLVLARHRAELGKLSGRQWGALVALAVIGGSVPYALFFRGLQLTSPVTGSLINHTQFLLVAVLAFFFLAERAGALVWGALVVLLIATNIGLNLGAVEFNEGTLLVAVSTLLFAAGVVLAKRLLRDISTLTVMSAKMSLGSLILVGYVAATGHLGAVAQLSAQQWTFVLATGLILLAFTITAFMALRYASATAVTAIPAASPIITTLLVVLAAGQVNITPLDGVSLVLMLLAAAAIFVLGQRREARECAAERNVLNEGVAI